MTDPTQALLRGLSQLITQTQRTAGYQARLEVERVLAPLRADPLRLEPHGFKVYSQHDEDGIIEEIFRRLGVARGQAAGRVAGLQDTAA